MNREQLDLHTSRLKLLDMESLSSEMEGMLKAWVYCEDMLHLLKEEMERRESL